MFYSKRFMVFFSLLLLLGGALYVAGGAAADEQAVTDAGNLFIQKDKLLASDKQSESQFGSVIALTADGQYLMVGAPLHDVSGNNSQGQVYVYQSDGQNGWIERQILTASDGAADDLFGASLAIATDYTLVVGAPEDDEGSSTDLGSAYVFTFGGGTWTEQAKLEATDDFAFSFNNRGSTVAISPDGRTVFVGAANVERAGGTRPGVVYIFDWDDINWNQIDTLVGPTTDAAGFGRGLAISGDGNTLAIGGLYRPSSPGAITWGRVYVYQQNSGSVWTEVQVLTASETLEFDEFGEDLAFNQDGSVLLVGASHNSIQAPGKVYIYTEGGGTWSEQQILNIPAGTEFGHFGAAVAVDSTGDYLAIGAWLNDSGGIHRYVRSGDMWSYTQTVVTADDRQEQLGYAVALSADGEVLVGGARSAHTDTDSFDNVGAIYSYGEGSFIYLPLVIRD